jgi:hypothetical protein
MRSWTSKARLSTRCTTSYSSGCSGFKPGLPSFDAKELHMRLRMLLPEQYKPQRHQLWRYREYTLKFPMPNGWSMKLWFRGEHLRVALSPPSTDGKVISNAA